MAKILIVDDEKHIRVLYAEELEEEGYEVAVASDGTVQPPVDGGTAPVHDDGVHAHIF